MPDITMAVSWSSLIAACMSITKTIAVYANSGMLSLTTPSPREGGVIPAAPLRARRDELMREVERPAGYHSLCSRMRRAANETNSSFRFPNSQYPRSAAAATSPGACRATYSLTASLNNWLRDFPLRRASRSALSTTASGMETAIFIPSE